ncbi:MAG: transposase [Verrucomicrobia bacterium]|nr:transposase [Verrucomicrobiota bacterium]
MSVSAWVKELKRISTKWLKGKSEEYHLFQWQTGYGVFSVSQSQSKAVEKYIAGQEEHHHKMTYQDEFRILLKHNGIECDERYIWG